MARSLAVACLGLCLASAACSRNKHQAPAPAATPGCAPVHVALLPPAEQLPRPSRWGVTLDVQHDALKTHRARLEKLGITPNGEAWAGLVEQCLAKLGPPLDPDVDLDPEAGSLHAWVGTDASKDHYVAALCRAVEDAKWFDACLAIVDRSMLDD